MKAPGEIIRAKRDGRALDEGEIGEMVAGLVSGAWSDAQAAAFAMAVCIRGMTTDERLALTKAMRDSGEVLDWDLPGPVVDKHSTGGVGDVVSLALAPALAACGAYVPMISGRGLGHTGGTLDKLEAIPGYDVRPDPARFRQVVADVGCAIIGQTAALAPADGRLYAIRDVTGTVESVDLITASILSKKLAAGLDALVLDVKCGSGAFMATRDEADELAGALVEAANGAGCPAAALVTDMNEPLAGAVGNALEVARVSSMLTGHEVDTRLWDVTAALGGEALALAGLAADANEGRGRIGEALASGAAAERFVRMIAALGGPADFIDAWAAYLPKAPVLREVAAPRSGFVAPIDARALGEIVVTLGGGRRRAEDAVNPAVGLDEVVPLGAAVRKGDALARIHAASSGAAERAAKAYLDACRIEDSPPEMVDDPVLGRIG